MKMPSRTMLLLLLASLNSAIYFEILEDSSNRPNGYTTINGNVLFFKKQGHSYNDLLHLNRDFAALGHPGDVQKC
jgi:hypothetical protein